MPTEGDIWEAFRAVLASAPAFLYGKARMFAEHGLTDPDTGKPMRGVPLRSQAAYVLANIEGWNDEVGTRTRKLLRSFLRESREMPMKKSTLDEAAEFYKALSVGLTESQARAGKVIRESGTFPAPLPPEVKQAAVALLKCSGFGRDPKSALYRIVSAGAVSDKATAQQAFTDLHTDSAMVQLERGDWAPEGDDGGEETQQQLISVKAFLKGV